MTTRLVFRLIPPRPTFTQDMTDDEAAIMARHAAHWQPEIEAGRMVVFGPILGETGAWGLGVIETNDEEATRELMRTDPALTSGLGRYEAGKMLSGFVRS